MAHDGASRSARRGRIWSVHQGHLDPMLPLLFSFNRICLFCDGRLHLIARMQHLRMAWLLYLWLLLQSAGLPCRASEATDAMVALALSLRTQGALPPLWSPSNADPASVCAWSGVECSADNHTVTGVHLAGVPMHGVLFRTFEILNRCAGLQHVNLSATGITGVLNARWKNISALHTVDLGFNRLAGTLPAGLWRNGNLEYLSLLHNRLKGELPQAWFRLRRLRRLNLSHNRLTGTVPPQWQRMEGLQELLLGSNGLTGGLPPLPRTLTTLSLWANAFNGTLPVEYAQQKALRTMVLDQNQLTGTLPPQWSALRNLTGVFLRFNALRGTLPSEWSALTGLRELNLRGNLLHGTLPSTWSAMPQLHHLDLSENRLSGALPSAWAAWKQLRRLYLSGNGLGGPLPRAWETMASLQKLDLSENDLGGPLPPEWAAMDDMRELYLDRNRLVGPVPSAWTAMANAYIVHLGHNRLTGALPAEWAAMRGLWALSLTSNALSGPLPPTWSALTSLTLLDLSDNVLSGPGVPSAWQGMGTLTRLDVSSNQLEGPPPLAEWPVLQYLNASHNRFTGSLSGGPWWPTAVVVDVSYNDLDGPVDWVPQLPPSLIALNASGNRFNSLPAEALQLLDRDTMVMVVLLDITFECPLPEKQALHPNLVLHTSMCRPPSAVLVGVGVAILLLAVSMVIIRIHLHHRAMYILQKGADMLLRYHPKYLAILLMHGVDLLIDPISYWHMFGAVTKPPPDVCAPVNSVRWGTMGTLIVFQPDVSQLVTESSALYPAFTCLAFPFKFHRCLGREGSPTKYVQTTTSGNVAAGYFSSLSSARDLSRVVCGELRWGPPNGQGGSVGLCAFDETFGVCRLAAHAQADTNAAFLTALIASCVLVHVKEGLKLLGVLYVLAFGMVSPVWLSFIRETPFIVLLMVYKPTAAREVCLHEYNTRDCLLLIMYDVVAENVLQAALLVAFTLFVSQSGIDVWVSITLLINVAAICYKVVTLASTIKRGCSIRVGSTPHLTSQQMQVLGASGLSPEAVEAMANLEWIQDAVPLADVDKVKVQPSAVPGEAAPPLPSKVTRCPSVASTRSVATEELSETKDVLHSEAHLDSLATRVITGDSVASPVIITGGSLASPGITAADSRVNPLQFSFRLGSLARFSSSERDQGPPYA